MARAVGDLVAQAGAVPPEADFELRESYNVAPTADVAVVLERLVEETPQRELHRARWGLLPGWAKDPSFSSRTFNARSETVVTKPSFRSAVRARRCAVPVDGYYEWLKPTKGSGSQRKRPFYVHPEDDSVMFFAGLYEWWKDPEAEATGEPAWVLSTTILTGASPDDAEHDGVLGELGRLHDRMPLPMGPEMMEAWLNPEKLDSADEAEALVQRVREQAFAVAGGWRLDEVGPAVGNVRNNGPELLEPVAGDPQESLLP